MTDFTDDLNQQIAELETALQHTTSPTMRRALERELADLKAQRVQATEPPPPTPQLPQAGDTANAQGSQGFINRPSGSVDQTFGNATAADQSRIYGPNVGVNLGTIIYGRTPQDDEKRRLVWYLERLAARLNQLPLQGLEEKLDKEGKGMALSSVYVVLATISRRTLADGAVKQLQPYFRTDDDKRLREALASGQWRQYLKDKYDSERALPDQAVFDVVPAMQQTFRLIRAMLAVEAVQKTSHLVLLGDPGSGKSTFVRHLAWALAERELEHLPEICRLPDAMRTNLPILVPLLRVARRLTQPGSPEALILAVLREEVTSYGIAPVDDLLNGALSQGAALVLLDGLDEVPVEGAAGERVSRLECLQAVRAFALQYQTTPMVLTCRVRAFADDLRTCLGWPVETLAPLTMGQVRHFVPAWYDELVKNGQLQPSQADLWSRVLLERIAPHKQLRELAQTPLLLTMMALVLYNKGELPRDRPKLYESILGLLLGQWDKVREGQNLAEIIDRPLWESSAIQPLLDALSYEAHRDATSEDGRGRLSRAQIHDALTDFLEERDFSAVEAGSAAVRCLDYFEQRSGLLVADGKKSYVFAHLTLQEHCAGRYLVFGSENPITLVMQHRTDDRWRVPIFLGLGLAPPADLGEVLDSLLARQEDGQDKPIERWYRDVILAADLGADRDWSHLFTVSRIKGRVEGWQNGLRDGLVELLNDPSQPLPVAERVRAGFLLGDLGDPRFPVTVEEWQREVARMQAGDTSGYFCLLQPGTYTIGSGDDDPDADDDEKPQHTITLEQPLWVARYPITNAQWQAWVDAGRRKSYYADDSDLNHPNQPVVGVSWHWVNEFCTWLSERVGITLRLPTEFEWEAAVRGGDARRYPWGNEWQDDRAATEEDQETRGWRWSVPVGCYPAGVAPCGALDMAGNVWEWTASDYLPYQQEAKEADRKVLRGGDYRDSRTNVRCGARYRNRPDDADANDYSGFRVFVAPHSHKCSVS